MTPIDLDCYNLPIVLKLILLPDVVYLMAVQDSRFTE